MHDRVAGAGDVPLLLEPLAVNTAENAVRSLLVISRIDDAQEVSRRLLGPARAAGALLLRRALSAPRLPRRLPLRAAAGAVAPLWAAELSSITRMVRDRRAALGLLGGEAVEGSLSPAGP